MRMTQKSLVLSAPYALLFSGLITGSYVGGLYLAPSARLSFVQSSKDVGARGERARQANERWRDDDDVIRARLQAAWLSTCASCGVVFMCVLSGCDEEDGWVAAIEPSLRLLGLKLPTLHPKSILSHLLIPMLYTGPLTARSLSGALPFRHCWSPRDLWRTFSTWKVLRNYVVAPITEELVFRACLLAIAELSGKGVYYKIFVTPLWFGIAHLHHAYELYNRFGRTRAAAVRAIILCLVQLTYTTLFGAYTSFLLLRTGSVLPPITAHAIANIMGLPELGMDLQRHPNHRPLIIVAYLCGLVGFIAMLGPWTA